MCLSKLRLALVALLASVAISAPLVVARRGLLDAGDSDNVDNTTAVLPQLALRVVATTPLELTTSSPSTDAPIVDVEGSQPIQAIFSRPVIALGEDGSAPAQQPFQLSCNNCPASGNGTQLQLGKFRWVTTFVARFDPHGEWPTDLDLDFSWNSNVTSWDGADLQEDNLQVRQDCRLCVAANRHFAACGVAASACIRGCHLFRCQLTRPESFTHTLLQAVVLRTSSLSLTAFDVSSVAAKNATDGAWTPQWRGTVEVPSDGAYRMRTQLCSLCSLYKL